MPLYPHMDTGKGTVRFADGTIGSMDVQFSTKVAYPTTEVELIGSEGNIVARVMETIRTEYTIYASTGQTTFRSTQSDAIYEEMRSWINALTGKGDFQMPAEEAAKILALCLAWAESTQTNQPVCL